jgi:hypothetical protein
MSAQQLTQMGNVHVTKLLSYTIETTERFYVVVVSTLMRILTGTRESNKVWWKIVWCLCAWLRGSEAALKPECLPAPVARSRTRS